MTLTEIFDSVDKINKAWFASTADAQHSWQMRVQNTVLLGATMENLFIFRGMARVLAALLITTRRADVGHGVFAGSMVAGPLAALALGSLAYQLIGESRAPWFAAIMAAVAGSALAVLLLEYPLFKYFRKKACA